VIRILPNGGGFYTPAPASQTTPERGECQGWTRAVSRRNTDFLMSVESDQLTGFGLALSLTIRDCPPAPACWHKVRRRFLERVRRMQAVRVHWLTEWQKRRVPHLHGAVWFPGPNSLTRVLEHWIQAAREFGAGPYSQKARIIDGPAGWFEYLAKHAARGVAHYQRSRELIPPEWQQKTGRMWGHSGDWPTSEAKLLDDVPRQVEHQFRRLMIRYQIGKARRQSDPRRLRYFRRYRSQAPRETSAAQALPRLWIPEDDQWALLRCAFDSHTPPDPVHK
jgi:hypothetical protein